ncbi:rab11 family-interacting protein 3 isoform X2 [Anguilla anguilla]|uniref:rab11 family-interacting protein 3 isoform X2 n=1 Tax=Anguilla anguilla TaxID=7936 RepID=UPI0015B2412C|nr:rab11 family-interacting protein 3 isoform X2 [Anguilla anguilla]
MDQFLLSSPGGHADWELEQKPSLGFLVLDPDKVAALPKGSKESLESGLDFRETGKELVSLNLDEILQENALNLDNLLRNSRYSDADRIMSWNERSECPVLQWENHSFPPLQLTEGEPADAPNLQVSSNEQIDFRVSTPVQTVAGSVIAEKDNSSFLQLDFQDKVPMELMNIHNSPGEHLSFNNTPPPLQVLAWNEESNKTNFSLLEKFLCSEPASSSISSSSPSAPLPSGASPQGVSEEPSLLSHHEESSRSQVSQGGETLSSETEDKGLFLELVRDPLTVSNAILEGSPESHPSSPSHTCSSAAYSQTLNVQEGSRLVQNGASNDISGSLSFEDHALHTSEEGCLSSHVDDTAENIPVDALTFSLPLKQCCEGDFCLPGHQRYLEEPEACASCPDGDAAHQDELLRGQGSDGALSVDLMEEKVFLGSARQEEHKELIGSSSPTADAMHDKETPDPKPPESTLQEGLPGLELNGRSGEAELDLDAVLHTQDCPEDLALELDGLPSGNLWMTEETAEGLLLSEVGASNSLPMGGSVSEGVDDLSSLKAVFNALDQDSDGFVRIEEFLQFATAYGAEQVKDLTGFLDPSGLGVISFEDFYRGIAAISNGGPDPRLCDVGFDLGEEAGVPGEYDDYATFENEVTDSAYLGSESTYSECETFTDEDSGALVHPELHEEVETDSAIDAALHDPEETGSRLSLGSELNSHSLVTVIGGEEEHFEDFGESHDLDLLLESPGAPLGEGSPAGQLHCSSLLLSPRADPFPASFQSFLREEALDFFCSQCHKQISRLEDLSTRLNFLEMNSSSKRLSSKKVARHLLQSSTLTIDSMDDLSRDMLDLADTDITDKVMFLEKRVSELETDSASNGEQHARLRQENLQLVHRANALEEQLKEQEARAEEALHLEVRRHKEALCKLERERGLELENLQSRLQQLDEENSELRSCVPCLRANIERLEEEKRKLQDSVEDVTERLNEELESRRKMTDKLTHERHKNQKEKECTQELIEDLRRQLEHLQLYKLEVEAKSGRSPSAGLQEYQNRTREAELEQEVRRLKQDNRSLKEQNDELNGQIINLSIQGAKNLFATSFSDSLAAEISSVSRDELMEAIHKQEEINYRLQDYIDRIIVAIMESNPSILEVK